MIRNYNGEIIIGTRKIQLSHELNEFLDNSEELWDILKLFELEVQEAYHDGWRDSSKNILKAKNNTEF